MILDGFFHDIPGWLGQREMHEMYSPSFSELVITLRSTLMLSNNNIQILDGLL